ncbi:MAG: LuxR C-terminal-related transcriptional regulator [Burkholderiales bacterium]
MSPTLPVRFALTKIQAPRLRADLIERPGLEGALRLALAEKPLTLLLAPAGWGKTAALARQIASLPKETALAWVSADEEDDVPRFLGGLAAALEPLDLPWRVAPGALASVAEAERGIRQVADELVNAFAESELPRALVIIDDVHRFTDPRLFELLDALIERLPPNLGVVMASRTEPPLQLARLRAHGELGEFKQSELGFDGEEVKALLRSQGIAPQRADELLKRTAGWPAGLRLMLNTGARTPAGNATSQRNVFDYLAAEVLDGMPADLRKFLLRSSVLPELSTARCAHVSALANARRLFEQVQREGLFVTPLDESGETLRLHDLFRDFLEERLQQEEASELPALLERAAEHEPDLERAVAWLARAGSWDRAAKELAARGTGLLPMGRAAAIERLIGLFPAAEAERYPELAFLRGLCAFQTFDFERLVESMDSAQSGFRKSGREDMVLMARVFGLRGRRNGGKHAQAAQGAAELRTIDAASERPYPADSMIGTLVSFFLVFQAVAEGHVDQIVAAFGECLDRLERVPEYQTWDNVRMMSTLAGLPGMNPLMDRFERGAMQLTANQASTLRVSVMHIRAMRALGAGRNAEAHDWLCNADDDLRWLGNLRSMLTENLQLHLLIDGARGDAAACAEAARQLRSDLARSTQANQRTHGSTLFAVEGRSLWMLGDAAGVRRIAREIAAARNPFEWRWSQDEDALLQGMAYLLDDRNAEAERVLARTGPVESSWMYVGSSCLVLCAEAQRRQNKLDAAAATLRRIIDSVTHGNPVGGAITSGAAVLDQLANASWGGRLTQVEIDELRRWLRLATGPASPVPAVTRSNAELPAALTEREADVLALIASGQSNKHIARSLDLSPFTLKRHVANILNKIGLDSRTGAALWWVKNRPKNGLA